MRPAGAPPWALWGPQGPMRIWGAFLRIRGHFCASGVIFANLGAFLHILAWPGLALPWPGPARPGPAWPGLAWPGPAWPGLAWPGLAGLAWPGLAWPGLACLAWPGLAWRGLCLAGRVCEPTYKFVASSSTARACRTSIHSSCGALA